MSQFKVGDRVRCVEETAILVKGREYTVVEPTFLRPGHYVFVNTGPDHGVLDYEDDYFEPVAVAPATASTLGIDLNPPPRVGDDVLIFGTIAAINQSPRGTNYNIVFETQNRRMSLHFLEEDFIVVDDDDGGCSCANNDNGPVPSTDTAKAFDAFSDWLRSLAVERAA